MRVLVEVAAIVAGGVGAVVCLAALSVRLPQGGPVFEPGLRPPVKTAVWPAQLVRLERHRPAVRVERPGRAQRAPPCAGGDRRGAPGAAGPTAGPGRHRGAPAAWALPRGSSSARPARRRAIPTARASRPATSSRSSTRWTRCDRADRQPCRARRARRPHPGRGRARGGRQAARARAGPARAAGRRPRAHRGQPWRGQDADGAVVRGGHQPALRARAVHARPDAVGRDRLDDLRPAQRRAALPARPDLHPHPARRRDQPRAAEDAGGAA